MTSTDRMVAWLRETLDAAWHDAETAANDLWWADHAERIEVYNAEGVLIAGADDAVRGLLDANNPAAVLRRIAADRELLDECETILSDPRLKDYKPGEFGGLRGYPHALAVSLAEVAIRNRAEAWGWTEEEQR